MRIPISVELRKRIFERDGFRCVYCGSEESLQIDHRRSVANGGTNEESNLAVACLSCNSQKGRKNYPSHEVGVPSCPNCKRKFIRGAQWKGANYCRGLFLMDQVKNSPGLSGWELSELTGLPYRDTVRGLERARGYDAIEARAEDKENGGIRYRYWPYPDHFTRRDAMDQKERLVTVGYVVA